MEHPFVNTSNLVRDRVLVVTEHDLIEGTLCYPRGLRLSDALNAPSSQRDKPNLALVDATVTRIATGQKLLASQFLLVARERIVMLMPTSEMTQRPLSGRPAPAEADTAVEDRGAAGDPVLSLARALKDRDLKARRAAAEALRQLGVGATAAVPCLLEAMSDADKFVRGDSMEALGCMGAAAADAVPRLADALQDDDEYVRRLAAKALGNLGVLSGAAVAELTKALQDQAEFVRRTAAEALGKIGPEADSALPALHEALDDKDLLVRHWAGTAIERIEAAAAAPAIA